MRWMLGPEMADGGATSHLRLNLRCHAMLLFRVKDFECAIGQCTVARYGTLNDLKTTLSVTGHSFDGFAPCNRGANVHLLSDGIAIMYCRPFEFGSELSEEEKTTLSPKCEKRPKPIFTISAWKVCGGPKISLSSHNNAGEWKRFALESLRLANDGSAALYA